MLIMAYLFVTYGPLNILCSGNTECEDILKDMTNKYMSEEVIRGTPVKLFFGVYLFYLTRLSASRLNASLS